VASPFAALLLDARHRYGIHAMVILVRTDACSRNIRQYGAQRLALTVE
jgi:hypothetical protein